MTSNPPRVRMSSPSGRPIQLRYTCPIERQEKWKSSPMTSRLYLGTYRFWLRHFRGEQVRKSLLSKVPEPGLEPGRPNGHWILNPARLPIPPLWQLS